MSELFDGLIDKFTNGNEREREWALAAASGLTPTQLKRLWAQEDVLWAELPRLLQATGAELEGLEFHDLENEYELYIVQGSYTLTWFIQLCPNEGPSCVRAQLKSLENFFASDLEGFRALWAEGVSEQ